MTVDNTEQSLFDLLTSEDAESQKMARLALAEISGKPVDLDLDALRVWWKKQTVEFESEADE